MRNLFVIRSPLELFNAIEARERFHQGEENHLMLVSKRSVDFKQMHRVDDGQWDTRRELNIAGPRQHVYPLVLSDALSRWRRRTHSCYIGLISHVPAHICNSIQPQEVVLLDDGNETLMLSREIERCRTDVVRRRHLRHRLLGMRTESSFLKSIRYFTMFHLPHVHEHLVTRNDFRCWREKFASLPVRDSIMFIASNMVPQFIADRSRYLRYLEKVRDYYAPLPVVYVCHRYESSGNRTAVRDLGFDVVQFDTILECAFVKQGWIPREVATTRSTAIDTLRLLYGIPGRVFRIPIGWLNTPAQQQEITALYHDYERRGITVEDVAEA